MPFFPVTELYLSDLQKVPPEEILKEIQAPSRADLFGEEAHNDLVVLLKV